jgi:hypothetical protein
MTQLSSGGQGAKGLGIMLNLGMSQDLTLAN